LFDTANHPRLQEYLQQKHNGMMACSTSSTGT
jgi:hypothetical protein